MYPKIKALKKAIALMALTIAGAANAQNYSYTGGIGAAAYGFGTTAIGSNATAGVNGSSVANATALGSTSKAIESNSTAVGFGSQANAVNSVAIGASSLANQANTVSFGAVGATRRLVNIADGVAATDATTVGQVNTAISAATTTAVNAAAAANNATNVAAAAYAVYIESVTTANAMIAAARSAQVAADAATATAAVQTNFDANNVLVIQNTADIRRIDNTFAVLQSQVNGIQNQVTKNKKESSQGVANVAAIAALPAIEVGKVFSMGLGYGSYLGESAMAIGAQARVEKNVLLKMGVSLSDKNHATSIGLGYSW